MILWRLLGGWWGEVSGPRVLKKQCKDVDVVGVWRAVAKVHPMSSEICTCVVSRRGRRAYIGLGSTVSRNYAPAVGFRVVGVGSRGFVSDWSPGRKITLFHPSQSSNLASSHCNESPTHPFIHPFSFGESIRRRLRQLPLPCRLIGKRCLWHWP
jgi:hypothetical protein